MNIATPFAAHVSSRYIIAIDAIGAAWQLYCEYIQ